MSSDDFKIVINSNDFYGNPSGNNNSIDYLFNFPSVGSNDNNAFYEMRFTFITGNTDVDPSLPCEIRIDFPNTKTYRLSNVESSSKGSYHIGYAYPIISGVTSYLSANLQDNAPTILRKPTNTNFTVSLYDANGALWNDNNVAEIPTYLLVLYFKKI